LGWAVWRRNTAMIIKSGKACPFFDFSEKLLLFFVCLEREAVFGRRFAGEQIREKELQK
jgi:hypothetical protein